MAPVFYIKVLGGLTITDHNGDVLKFSSRKAEAILTYVIFSEKAYCVREELAALFWEDMPESNALANLRVTLANIKKISPELLSVSRRRISINSEIKLKVDALELMDVIDEFLISGNLSGSISLERAKEIAEILPVYYGDFLKGFFIREAIAFEDWAAFKRESLRTAVVNSSQLVINAFYENGLFSEGISVANNLLFIDSYNDAGFNWLIKLYAADGQRDAALAAFEKYKQILEDGLGIEPTGDVLKLIELIKAGKFIPQKPDLSKLADLNLPIPNNIPLQVTEFFGRHEELQRLNGYLLTPGLRLVSLIGQGGSGKTRLAVAAAKKNMENFPDGVWFIALEDVVSPDLVLAEIYKQLKITFPEKQLAMDQLVNFLNGHRILIVLDNFEHLLDANPIISEIILKTQNSKFIVTSREMTGLPEEVLMMINGLSLNPERTGGKEAADELEGLSNSSPAAALFVDRARRIRSSFSPTNEDVLIIEEICELVAGLPIGIELAAPSIRNFELEELRNQIAGDINFLKTEKPDLPIRQRSLNSVFNTFWDQLSDEEQLLICRLSVFQGVVTAEAAKKVAGVSIFFLSSLVSRGLLQRMMPKGYRAHSIHRLFVYEKLKTYEKEFNITQEKHRDYYLFFLKKYKNEIRDKPQKDILDEIEFEQNNIRAALSFTIKKGEKEKALEICELLMPFWKIRGYYQEGYYWLDQTINLTSEVNRVLETSSLTAASKLVSMWGDYEAAESLSLKSLQIAKKLGDQHSVARALNSIGAAKAAQGEIDQAATYFNKSLDIYRNLRVQQAIAGTLVNVAVVEIKNRALSEARIFLEEALAIFRIVGDSVGIVHVLHSFAKIELIEVELKKAYPFITEALKIAWGLGAKDELVKSYLLLSKYHMQNNELDKSVGLLAVINDVTTKQNFKLNTSDQFDFGQILEFARNRFQDNEFDLLWTVGIENGESKIIRTYL